MQGGSVVTEDGGRGRRKIYVSLPDTTSRVNGKTRGVCGMCVIYASFHPLTPSRRGCAIYPLLSRRQRRKCKFDNTTIAARG